MKSLFYILVLLAFSAHAQLYKMRADSEFLYSYGGINYDDARDIKETPDKGYLLVGTTTSFGPGQASVYMIKTDSLGNHIWSTMQGGTQDDRGYAVELTRDSGFFVAGYSNSFNPEFYHSAYYFKTDKNGKMLWQKSIDQASESFAYGSCALPDSGFLLCGQTYATSSGNADAYLIRVDKKGDTLWTNHYGGDLDETFNGVSVINNRIYAVGSNSSHPADSASDGWIVKLDMNGKFLLDSFISFGPGQKEILNGITPYPGSLFTVCGNRYRPDSNATTGIICRYDTTFFIKTNITDSSLNFDIRGYYVEFNKVLNISNGSICVIGTITGGLGGTGMFFAGFNTPGYTLAGFYPADGGSKDDNGYSGIYTSSGRVIGVGSTYSTQDYCTNPHLSSGDAFLVRSNADSIHTNSVVPEYSCFADTFSLGTVSILRYGSGNEISLYPNPVYEQASLAITGSYSDRLTVRIYSLLGEEISSNIADSNKNTLLNFSSLPEGSYFLKVMHENGNLLSILKFVVIHP